MNGQLHNRALKSGHLYALYGIIYIMYNNDLGKHHGIESSIWVTEGLPGVLGNRGTKKKYCAETVFGNLGTTID